jgi:uncharacterized protein YggE
MKVVSVIKIEEQGSNELPRPMMMAMAGTEQVRVGAQPPIEAGELQIRAIVTLTATIR